MTTVAKKFKIREVVGALVGIELEIEGRNLPASAPEQWDVKRDGSLRNGLEYVFRGPLGSVATKEALEALGEHLKASGAEPSYSFRTSSHVHVNVSNLEMDVVKTMAALFTLFEDEYINFCSRTRKANRFCLSSKDAEGVIHNLKRFLEAGVVPPRDRGKYSAMNLCTLEQFGTLEFRTLEGTNDWNRIFTWVRALLALRKAAKEIGSVAALMKIPHPELAKMVFPTERLRDQFLKEGWEERFQYTRSICWDALYTFSKD